MPILYSFRRCPYAMRARLALAYSGQRVELREIVLKNKPQTMLDISPKGTVPVLLLDSGRVVDESRDIMSWALSNHDPKNWLRADNKQLNMQIHRLMDRNDAEFKGFLDKYKYADRFPEFSQQDYRQQGEAFLATLESLLAKHQYLLDDRVSVADIAIFPFVRQFAFVDQAWFFASDYPALINWLNNMLASQLFADIMFKYPAWQPGDRTTYFPLK